MTIEMFGWIIWAGFIVIMVIIAFSVGSNKCVYCKKCRHYDSTSATCHDDYSAKDYCGVYGVAR